jgi:hypothetical protein
MSATLTELYTQTHARTHANTNISICAGILRIVAELMCVQSIEFSHLLVKGSGVYVTWRYALTELDDCKWELLHCKEWRLLGCYAVWLL